MHNISFKDPSLVQEYEEIKPSLKMILEDMALYCQRQDQPFVITDILSDADEDKKLKRVSKSHQEGRAADIRTRDWSQEFREKFIEHFSKLYERYAAISKETGKPRLILYHDNGIGGIHCHAQVRA